MNNQAHAGGSHATQKKTSAHILAAELQRNGVDRIFCVPGESFLAVLDALLDFPEIAVVTCRQEGGAAMMAEAYGKLTGRPGVVFVTRGPGATNASAGVHVAYQDSTPLLMFVGQIERAARERGAFQEVDMRAAFAPLSKWATEIEDGARIPEIVGRAFRTATSGRPGPVVIGLPEDMLRDEVDHIPALAWQPTQARLAAEDASAITAALSQASRPLLLIGGGDWSAQGAESARAFAEAWRLPVISAFRCQDFIDNGSDCYVGTLGLGPNPGLLKAVQECDLLIAIGTRLDDITMQGYDLLRVPLPTQKLIHVYADPTELGRVYQPWLGIVANATSTFERLAGMPAPAAHPWGERTTALRQGFLAWTTPPVVPGPLQPGEIITFLRKRLPQDAIITNGAGNFATWPNRFYHYRHYRSMLAPISGSMGYGVPAAIAAKLTYPERMVVAFAGDGDFLMTGQELATAAQEKVAIIVILINNGMYGTIRMHQEMHHPGRISATTLQNPDFVLLAQAYGAYGERITYTEQFEAGFERAVASGRSAVLELVLDPEVITPTQTITSLRASKRAQTD